MELEELYLLAKAALDNALVKENTACYFDGINDSRSEAVNARTEAHDAITALAAFAAKALADEKFVKPLRGY